jgi:hypothetical protein
MAWRCVNTPGPASGSGCSTRTLRSRTFAEFPIDAEEDPAARTSPVGVLRMMEPA